MEAITKSNKVFAILLVALVSGAGALSLAARNQQQPTTEPSSADTTVTAKTTSGLLKGIKQATGHQEGAILKFLAVPYAEAPIGSLRFKRPEELKGQQSKQVLNASQYGRTCPQYRHLTQFISPLLNVDADHQTSEDCLQLNVFVPANVGSINQQQQQQQLEPNKQLPVIVWIPGEGFDFADARQFDGSNLALKTQSIVVTVQYRVGVLGFLHAPKLNITGNMGIYDQIMALKWVRKNIDQFGGDSERVTLMGRFSGSMSISTMITAPNHKDLLRVGGKLLFQRVALLSGIAVDDWIIDSQQYQRVAHLEEAAMARDYCSHEQVWDGSCLGGLPVEQLMRIADYGWRLVKDNELIGEQAPIEALKGAPTAASELEAVLLGETGMEGTLCMYRHVLDTRTTNYAQLIHEDKLTSNDLYNVIRDDSQTYFRYNPNKTNPIELALGSLIESSTGGDDDDDDDMVNQVGQSAKLREKYLNACSAYMVKSHSRRFKRNLLARSQQPDNRMDASKKAAEVYHYELRYKPSFSLAPHYIRTAAHGDDIPLLFGLVYNQPRAEINEADLLMTRKMMSYIGNFVHGNQPSLAASSGIETRFNETTMDDGDISLDSQQQQASLTINMKPRSWADEGQLNHIEFDETDLQELNARRRRRHHQHQRQSSNGCSKDNCEREVDAAKPGVRADKSVNIRLILVEGINQQQQQESNELLVQRRRQLDRQQLPSQQTNMTLINESSFLTMLLFACLMMLALIFTCLGVCVIIFRGSLSLANASREQANKQHYVNSSTSSCNICEESQVGSSMGARGKDARVFSNVFAKLRNNQHQPSQPSQPQPCQLAPIDGQSREQTE